MCVIMIANKVRPSDEMIRRAWEKNPDGGGVSWRSTKGGKPVVEWKKGIKNVEDMLDLIHKAPLPHIEHFRIGTVGGPKPTLTHPFMIDADAGTDLEGTSEVGVLFHNGHWSDWDGKSLEAAIHSNSRIPVGDWSDTRAMAWMVHIYGHGFMELMTQQKGVIWTPKDMRVFLGRDGWTEINKVWCSNDHFWTGKKVYNNSSSKVCLGQGCRAWVWDGDYCYQCKQKGNKSTPSLDDASEEHPSSSSETSTEKKGNSEVTALAPLMQGGARPLVKFFTLEEMQELHRRGGRELVSKNCLKEYEKLYPRLGQGGNREVRAVNRMIELSNRVGKTLLSGSVH